MAQNKKAAIDIDAIGDKRLSDISAADFLSALQAGGLASQHLYVWPEKKKFELWVEPENDFLGGINVRDFFEQMRKEKKKLELEKFPGFENWRDPRDFVYEDLLNRLTRDLESRLRLGR